MSVYITLDSDYKLSLENCNYSVIYGVFRQCRNDS